MSTLFSIKARRKLDGTTVTVSAAISIDIADGVASTIENGVPDFFELLDFDDKMSCLDELEDALIKTIERYL